MVMLVILLCDGRREKKLARQAVDGRKERCIEIVRFRQTTLILAVFPTVLLRRALCSAAVQTSALYAVVFCCDL